MSLGIQLPNRMRPITALNLLLLGSALLLLDIRTRRVLWPVQYLALAAAFTTWLPILGYVYGTISYVAIALHTALALVVLSVGILCTNEIRAGVYGDLRRRQCEWGHRATVVAEEGR